MKIAGLGGSLRERSFTLAALSEALQIAAAHGVETRLFDVRRLELPMFLPDQPIEAYLPKHQINIREFISGCRECDAMIWASPAYHGTVSGVIKNAIDFIELMADDSPAYLTGRAIGLIAINDTITWTAMRDSVHELRAWLAPTSAMLVQHDFTDELRLKEGRSTRRLERMVNELIEFCEHR